MSTYDISKLAAVYTDYDMIKAYTELPPFPKKRVQLLQVFLSNGALKSEERDDVHRLYALAVALIQMGLDTHDMVDAESEPTDLQQMRSIQLKVLGGDYLSSRFYALLAAEGRVDFIQMIAQAISELCHLKMRYYLDMKKMRLTIEQTIQRISAMKMQLFLPFTQMMKSQFAERWKSLLQCVSSCEVIVEQMGNKQANSDYLQSLLAEQLTHWRELISKFESESMIEELNSMRQRFLSYLEMPQLRKEI